MLLAGAAIATTGHWEACVDEAEYSLLKFFDSNPLKVLITLFVADEGEFLDWLDRLDMRINNPQEACRQFNEFLNDFIKRGRFDCFDDVGKKDDILSQRAGTLYFRAVHVCVRARKKGILDGPSRVIDQ